MPTVFTIPEVLKLADIGVFTLGQVTGIIPVGTVAPVKVHLAVPTYWSVITERYNFGMTTVAIPPVFYYEMYYDRGFYCNGYVCQSDIDNRCTHLMSAQYIEPWFYNVSAPAMDIAYDFTVWYFTYPDAKKQEVFNLLYTLSEDESEIMRILRAIHQSVISGAPGPSLPIGGGH